MLHGAYTQVSIHRIAALWPTPLLALHNQNTHPSSVRPFKTAHKQQAFCTTTDQGHPTHRLLDAVQSWKKLCNLIFGLHALLHRLSHSSYPSWTPRSVVHSLAWLLKNDSFPGDGLFSPHFHFVALTAAVLTIQYC